MVASSSHRPHSLAPRSASRRAHGPGLGHGQPGGSAGAGAHPSDPSLDDPHAASSGGPGADAKDGLELEPATLSALTMRFMPLIECFLTVCANVALKAPPPMQQDTAPTGVVATGSKGVSTTLVTSSQEASSSSSSSSRADMTTSSSSSSSSSSTTSDHVTGGKRKASDAELDVAPPPSTTIDMTVETTVGAAADEHAAGVIAIADAIREGGGLVFS